MARFLGIDWGERRIGMAVSDPTATIARPLRTCEVRSPEEGLEAVRVVLEEIEADAVVVGVPINMDGTTGEIGRRAEAFAGFLRERAGVPVHLWDERLTTVQAERVLRDSGLRRAKRKKRRDGVAAQIILQNFLDARRNTGESD